VSGQWFEVDMGSASTFNQLVLNSVNSPNDYPHGYQVNVSNDGINWGSPVAAGTGTYGLTEIAFAAQVERYIRITQTGSVQGTFWSIDEFNVLGTVSTTPPQIVPVLSGGRLQLSWPPDHVGWRLEAQTNAPGAGLGTNWVTVANSAATNQVFLPINAANGSVFFRLAYP
jgi:hypothetical protein